MDTPRQVLDRWVAAFNRRDAHALAALYHEDAVNWQLAAGGPTTGRAAIFADCRTFFQAFPDNFTHPENWVEAGEWVALEWSGGGTWLGDFAGRPPTGKKFTLRGCGFFRVVDGLIQEQRGYGDRATWFGQIGIPVEAAGELS